jgi:hypothetical protein
MCLCPAVCVRSINDTEFHHGSRVNLVQENPTQVTRELEKARLCLLFPHEVMLKSISLAQILYYVPK